jgi:hypothetical protein
MNYQDDRLFRARPDLNNVCLGGGLDPRNERPVFAWRTLDTLQIGPDVPLAKVRVQKGALVASPDPSVRRYAARLIRPNIGVGALEAAPRRQNLWSEIQVDTSDAGFTNIPQYFARVSPVSPDTRPSFVALSNTYAYIDRATPTSFFYNVFVSFFASSFAVAENARLRLDWIGIEPVTGCEPIFHFQFIFNLAGILFSHLKFTTRLEVPR